MRILVIDGQGGGIGRQLISALRALNSEVEIIAVGTNAAATAAMLKAGASQAATGENAALVACRRADIIAGPLGIIIADALLGEITPSMAAAIGQSQATRVLIPAGRCNSLVVGMKEATLSQLCQEAAQSILAL